MSFLTCALEDINYHLPYKKYVKDKDGIFTQMQIANLPCSFLVGTFLPNKAISILKPFFFSKGRDGNWTQTLWAFVKNIRYG